MLKVKLQYFGHLMRRTDSLEKTLMLGKFEGRRRRSLHWEHGVLATGPPEKSLYLIFSKSLLIMDVGREGPRGKVGSWPGL